MNENYDAMQRREMKEWRREHIAKLLSEVEAVEEIECDEAVQAALDIVLRWMFAMQRDVQSRSLARRGAMATTNRLMTGVFDWRSGVEGEILQERIARLQHFEYSITEAIALFDEVSEEGLVAEWIEAFSHCHLSNQFAPPSVESFKRPILKTLQHMGNFGKAKTVLQVMRETVGAQTNDMDFTRLATPHITSQQWRNIGNRAARQMTQKGLLIRDSGDWAITREGEMFLEENEK